MFYGKVVTAGKPLPLVPHPDGYSLHLSQASLPASLPKGSRLSLLIKVADEEPVVLCTLCAGAQDTVLLDQFLDEYAELSVAGNDSIHITGYYSPQFGGEAESEEEGEDYEDDEYGVRCICYFWRWQLACGTCQRQRSSDDLSTLLIAMRPVPGATCREDCCISARDNLIILWFSSCTQGWKQLTYCRMPAVHQTGGLSATSPFHQ